MCQRLDTGISRDELAKISFRFLQCQILLVYYTSLFFTNRLDMDHLSPLFDHFSPSAKVFFSGNMCETSNFDDTDGCGYLHLLRAGTLEIVSPTGGIEIIDQPSLMLHPRPLTHRLRPVHDTGAELLCATIDLGIEVNSPLVAALPDTLLVALADMPKLEPTLTLLFEESNEHSSGQQAALDRLTEYLLILLLRNVIEKGTLSIGILAGLSDPRLHRAIKAIHEHPDKSWTLEDLAEQAAMSRARFALQFRETTGFTPLNYLTQWRMSIACSLLRKGTRIERIATAVGYSSQSALTRVFVKHIGKTPREWLAKQNAELSATK